MMRRQTVPALRTCVVLLAGSLVGCGEGPATGSAKGKGEGKEEGMAEGRLVVKSPAFAQGQGIPKKHTGEGEDVSPALEWSGAPEGTKQFAVVCDDPDAPRPEPWVHWVAWGIPGDAAGLEEGVSGLEEGNTSWGAPGYRGPMPPPGHGVHRYFFKVYALDATLDLAPGATKDELLAAVKGHVLAEGELVGTYERR
jgi:Raf kinase inhibitor-like YbhB/YbcL family protein